MGAGSSDRGPSGVCCFGRERRDVMSACTPSRAVDCRYSSRFELWDIDLAQESQ